MNVCKVYVVTKKVGRCAHQRTTKHLNWEETRVNNDAFAVVRSSFCSLRLTVEYKEQQLSHWAPLEVEVGLSVNNCVVRQHTPERCNALGPTVSLVTRKFTLLDARQTPRAAILSLFSVMWLTGCLSASLANNKSRWVLVVLEKQKPGAKLRQVSCSLSRRSERVIYYHGEKYAADK